MVQYFTGTSVLLFRATVGTLLLLTASASAQALDEQKIVDRISEKLADVSREIDSNTLRDFWSKLATGLGKDAPTETTASKVSGVWRKHIDDRFTKTLDETEGLTAAAKEKLETAYEELLNNIKTNNPTFEEQNPEHWKVLNAAAIKALQAAAKKTQAVAKGAGLAEDFWKATADDYGTTYWDEAFDESAIKLADRFDRIGGSSDALNATALWTSYLKEITDFLNEIDNRGIPEKRASWADLLAAWREELIKKKTEGAFDPKNAEAVRAAFKNAADALRKTATEWKEERILGTKSGSGGSRGTMSGSGGTSGSSSGTSWSAVHHARAMARIRRIHGRHSYRIERINAR